MFDVNGIEDFYDKNAMVTYEVNGHEIPVHLKQKYTPQTKALFPEYNRDNAATAGAMTKSPPADAYHNNVGINCQTTLTCATAINQDTAESKTNVAQQLKGDKNLLAIRNLLQLHSNQYGENHGPTISSTKNLDLNQEKVNKEILDKAYESIKLPWKFSDSSGHLNNNYNSETKNSKFDGRSNEVYNKFANAILPDENHRVSEDTGIENHRLSEDSTGMRQPLRDDENKISNFEKIHSGTISTLPSLEEIHAMENSHDELIKQFDHENNMLPSKDRDAAGILNKLPNEPMNTQSHDNDLESSRIFEPSRDSSDINKIPNRLANTYVQDDLDRPGDMTSILNRPVNHFVKPFQQSGLIPSRNSPGVIEKSSHNDPPGNAVTPDAAGNTFNDIDDADKGKAKVRILSLLGELTDKLKGVEAAVSAQHNAAQVAHVEENSDISQLHSPEKSDSSESPVEQLQHSFEELQGNSYRPLQMVSKFEQKLPQKPLEQTHNSLEPDDGKILSKEQDFREYLSGHNPSIGNSPQIDGHAHQPSFTAHSQNIPEHDVPFPLHDFPHTDLHVDAHHDDHSYLDMNSPHIVSGTTPQDHSELSRDAPLDKLSHDTREPSNTNEIQPDDHRNFDHYIAPNEGVYHGSIREVDLKQAHQEIDTLNNEKTDYHAEQKAEGNNGQHEQYSKFNNKPSSESRKVPNTLPEADTAVEKEKEKLIPAQIQNFKDQDKPFVMNTASIDYDPKDHKEEDGEVDHSLASITPDFKSYEDSSIDDERGRISKYHHSPQHTRNDNIKYKAYHNDDIHGKSSLHGISQENKRPESDIVPPESKSSVYNHEDSGDSSRNHHHEYEKEYNQQDRSTHHKQSESNRESHEGEYHQSGKTKESLDKEFGTPRDKEYNQSDKTKDSHNKESDESHNIEDNQSTTGKLSQNTEFSLPEKSKELHETGYERTGKSRESDKRKELDKDRETPDTWSNNKDHETEDKDKNKGSKYHQDDNEEYITNKLKEHISHEHEQKKIIKPDKDLKHDDGVLNESKSKAKKLLESLTNEEDEHQQNNTTDHHKETDNTEHQDNAADHHSNSTIDEHHKSDTVNEHHDNLASKDQNKPQINEDTDKSKLSDEHHKPLSTDIFPQAATENSHESEIGTDRERTFTPKSKYTGIH